MKTTRILITALALLVAAALGASAEEAKELEPGKWYPSLTAGFNLTQSAYSDNWSGGDKGSIVWTAILDGALERQLGAKVNWNNTLKLAFGQTHNQSRADGELTWDEPEKSTDLIDFNTIFRFTLGYMVDPYVSGRFESQFQDATDGDGRIISLNPMQFSEAVGVAHKFIGEENRELMGRMGVAVRQNRRSFFTEDYPSTTTESEMATDGGLEVVVDFKDTILNDEVIWTSGLRLFQPFFFSGKSDLDDLTETQLTTAGLDADIADYSMMMDVSWENMFTTKLTEHLTVNLYTQWKYDKYDNSVVPVFDAADALTNGALLKGAVRKAGQFKQTLSLGLVYTFL